MEFKDRVPVNPGRVKLIPVSGQANTYDLELADGAASPNLGTPLNKATFDSLKDDILTSISNNSSLKGPKGDTGSPGNARTSSWLVGINDDTYNLPGWYKIGHVVVSANWDYRATMQISSTLAPSAYGLPNGIIDIRIRKASSDWELLDLRWHSFSGANPHYIKYVADFNSSRVTFYAYIPENWRIYRIDMIGESNRDRFDSIMIPPIGYGVLNTSGYSQNEPSETRTIGYATSNTMFKGRYTAKTSTKTNPFTSNIWTAGDMHHYATCRRIGDRDGNFYELTVITSSGFSADRWIRIDLEEFGLAGRRCCGCQISFRAGDLNFYTNYYPLCYAFANSNFEKVSDDGNVRYIFVGLDDRSVEGYTLTYTCHTN